MFLGVTVAGWLLLGMFYFPFVVLALVILRRKIGGARWFKNVAVIGAAFILFALPISDAAIGAWRMRQECSGAGLEIYRRVVVDGYFDETLNGSFLKGSGYRFREYMDPLKGYVRAEISSGGSVIEQRIERPSARFRYQKGDRSPLGFGVVRREERIVDSETNETLAKFVYIGRSPGFIDRIWISLFGTYRQDLESCHPKRTPDLAIEVKNILVPAEQ